MFSFAQIELEHPVYAHAVAVVWKAQKINTKRHMREKVLRQFDGCLRPWASDEKEQEKAEICGL